MNTKDEIDLKDYWGVLKRRKWTLLVSVLLGTGIMGLVNTVTPPVYQAASRIMIQREATRSPLTGEVTTTPSAQSDNLSLDTSTALITNRRLLEQVFRELQKQGALQSLDAPMDLIETLTWRLSEVATREPAEPQPPAIPLQKASLAPETPSAEEQTFWEDQVDRLSDLIRVEPVAETRLVDIQVQYVDPVVASQIANTVAGVFIDDQARQRTEEFRRLIRDMDGQLTGLKRRIESSERAFYDFKDRSGLFSLEGKLQEQTSKIGELNDAYIKTKTDRLAIGARLDRLKEVIGKKNIQDWRELPIQNGTLESLWKDYLTTETELAKAREVYKAQHPKLKSLESAREAIETGIWKELNNAALNLKTEQAILATRERQLRSAVSESERESHTINKKALQYSILERDVHTNRELYNLLLTKLKETEVARQIRTPVAYLVEPSRIPGSPVRPHRGLNLALGLVFGAMAGTLLAFLKEYLQETIRTSRDVTLRLQLPVLGIIPKGTRK